eukprot:CAMPEP_0172498694 /NCGR_PEP_ID=MMETSP1066-20121228/116021_1 /TAXON_ID=671091 /ORGANISM="Coscinodiscus wailesii, Strain CCMP2513" /LENGTH=214 /DNA_ID=CAMNT_0013272079 /DNA_START=46 /DNA_END=690 /DNA_ORIENTATION=-
MSSWDRSRRIPWTHIDQTIEAKDVENSREKIYRRIQRERHQLEKRDKVTMPTKDSDGVGTAAAINSDGLLLVPTPALVRIRRDYSTWDLVKRTGFGVCLGSITGGVFGFMDSMRQAGDSTVLKKASTGAKAKFLFQGTTRSGMLFGSFFGGFHALKYGVELVADPGEYTQIAIAGAVSMGALVAKPALRSSLPYAGMLIAMETFNVVMRDSKSW